MADVTITNLTTDPLYIGDIYATVPASGSVVVQRSTSDLARMSALQAAIAANSAAVSVVQTAAELASGLAVIPGSVQAADMAPVAATDIDSGEITIRKTFTAGVAGTPDDITIFAAGSLPYKMRVLDAVAVVSAISAGGGALLQVRSEAAGAGTLCAEMSSGTTGHQAQTATVTATQVVTPGTSVGLFIRRLNRDAAGEVIVTVRRES